MAFTDRKAVKNTEEVLQAMNEMTGWESRKKEKITPKEEIKRDKK